MNIPTCYRCPERHRDLKRCEILQAKLDAVKGIGLTMIRFQCEKRPTLFQPGEVVEFNLWNPSHPEGNESMYIGTVMRYKDRKVLIHSEETEHSVLWLWTDKLRKTGARKTVCVHCGLPRGADVYIRDTSTGKDKEWDCRGEYNIDTNSVDSLPCEYPTGPQLVQESA